MKYLLLTCALLCAGGSISQSKKKQIEILQNQLDSLSKVNVQLHESKVLVENEGGVLRENMKRYVVQVDSLDSVIINLKVENLMLQFENRRAQEKIETSTNSRTPSSTNRASYPFGAGGSGGVGTGAEASNGDGLGRRIQYGKGRTRLNNVRVNNIVINEDAKIYYKLTVDAEGNVISFNTYRSKNTTKDQNLINQIGAAIKKQVKYNTEERSPLVYQDYTISIKAN